MHATQRPFQTRFRFGFIAEQLNLAAYIRSPDRSTKSTTSDFDVLCVLVGTGFQVLFHSPPGVLFTFPSQYYSCLLYTSEVQIFPQTVAEQFFIRPVSVDKAPSVEIEENRGTLPFRPIQVNVHLSPATGNHHLFTDELRLSNPLQCPAGSNG